MKININEVGLNDIFSEISHYQVTNKTATDVIVKHLESGKEISLNNSYVESLLKSSDQYQSEVTVGLENKYYTQKQIDDAKKKGEDVSNIKVGDLKQLGIKSLFENIHSSQVFTVCFKKKDTPLSAKKLKELQEAQIVKALEEIEKTSKAKKGVLEKAKEILVKFQQNPILDYIEGEERVLRGYKLQFKSEDGFYEVCDMDIQDTNNSRLVNINSLKWLVFDGVKYSIEK
jgi:hypothetical protein